MKVHQPKLPGEVDLFYFCVVECLRLPKHLQEEATREKDVCTAVIVACIHLEVSKQMVATVIVFDEGLTIKNPIECLTQGLLPC